MNLERFEREIQLAARLQHPHIVALLTTGASGDLLYYIMPYIAGESLRVKLTREAELPVGETVRILREVMDALAYAHRNGVVHRDIKPDNVLISERHAVVTDFGVAKAVSASSGGASSLTSLGVALGTPAYMSPRTGSGRPARGPSRRHLCRGRTGLRDAHGTNPVHRTDTAGPASSADHPGAPSRCSAIGPACPTRSTR